MADRRSGNKPLLWVTDPWDTLDHAKDTTLRLANECLALGRDCWWADVRRIRFESGKVRVDAQELLEIPPNPAPTAVKLGPPRARRPGEFHSIHFRTDPPVDLGYIHPLQLLALEEDVPIVNPARILLGRTEKIQAPPLSALMPPTLVAADWDALARFGEAEGRTVFKPLHEAQSKGVELLDWRTDEGRARARQVLEEGTAGFARPVLLQRFLAGIAEGEQRLWFLDGKLLACARKMPKTGDFRVNIDGGSQIVATTLNRREKAVTDKIAKALRADKIRLAAVDLIEGFITDFNFTSPGLIVAMEAVLKTNLARGIARAISR